MWQEAWVAQANNFITTLVQDSKQDLEFKKFSGKKRILYLVGHIYDLLLFKIKENNKVIFCRNFSFVFGDNTCLYSPQ